MSKISKDYIKSRLWYRFNEKETYRTLLHRGDKFYRGDCILLLNGFKRQYIAGARDGAKIRDKGGAKAKIENFGSSTLVCGRTVLG